MSAPDGVEHLGEDELEEAWEAGFYARDCCAHQADCPTQRPRQRGLLALLFGGGGRR